jgi:hypothetical protein
MWDMRCSAGCTAWRKLRDARRGAERRGARGRRFPGWKDRLPGCDTGRGTQGRNRFPSGGVPFRRIGDEGSKGESDVKRCPPMFHSWARSCRWEDSRGGARPRYTVGHTPAWRRGDRGRGTREMRESIRPRFIVGYRLLTRRAGRGGLSPGRV